MAYSKARRLADLVSGDGTIDTTKILDATITEADIANDAITAGKIADNIALAGNITTTGTLAPTGVLTANAGIVVDNITIDGTQIDLSSGDLTLDVAGDIILDAGGQNWYFDDDGTRVFSISQVSSDVYLGSEVSDKDIFIRVNDGGSTITALTIDGSDAGTATFNHDVNVGGDLAVTGDLNITGDVNSTSVTDLDVTDKTITVGKGQAESASGGSGLVVDGSNASILWDESNGEWDFNNPIAINNAIGGDTVLNLTGSYGSGNNVALLGFARSGGAVSGDIRYVDATTDMEMGTGTAHAFSFKTGGTRRVRIGSDGYVGIGGTATARLHIIGNSDTSDADVMLKIQDDDTSTGSKIPAIGFYGGSTLQGRIRGGDSAFTISADPGNRNDIYITSSSGFVGINTNSPAGNLHVVGASSNAGRIYLSDADEGTGATDSLLITKSGTVSYIYDRDASSQLRLGAADDNDILTIDGSNARVGIGTTSPNLKLHVEESTADNWIGEFKHTHADAYGLRVDLSGTTSSVRYALGVYTGGGTGFFVRNNGTVGIGTNAPIAPLHVAGNAIIETGSPDLYLATSSASHTNWRIAAQEVVNQGFEIASGTTSAGSNALADTYTTRLTIKSDGKVGIGTTSPSVPLDVYNGSGWGGVDIDGTSGGELRLLKAGTMYGNLYSSDSHGLVINAANGLADILFSSGGSVKMVILDSGNVGVNDTNPDRKVSIIGDSTSNGQYPLSLDATNTDYTLEFRRNGTSEWWIAQSGSAFKIHENGVGDHFRLNAGGFLGLGTSPQRKLHIIGPDGTTSLTEGNSRTSLFIDNAGATYVNLASANTSNAAIFFSDADANNRGALLYKHASDTLAFSTAATERLTIDSSGNVQTSASYRTTSQVPFQFYANSSNNTYMQTTTYAHQNNSSGNFNNGIHIEMGRISDSSSAEVRAFVVGARGGQSAFKVLNGAQAGITQADGDYLGRFYVDAGDAHMDLRTGEGTPIVRTRISSYGTSFINSNSNGLSTTSNALIIGTSSSQKSGSLKVKGASMSGGILTRSNSAQSFMNVCTAYTTGSSNRYWHIKTNITTSMNIMFVAHVEGYSYGNSGNIIDVKRSGYMYAPQGGVINTTTENFGSTGGLNLYNSSDNYLCFVCDFVGGYYSGGRFHIEFPSPAGYSMDFQVTSNVMNGTSSGHY